MGLYWVELSVCIIPPLIYNLLPPWTYPVLGNQVNLLVCVLFVFAFGPVCTTECSRETKRESEGLQGQQLQVQQESWELSLSEVILLLHVLCCNPFSISNNIDLSRGCRPFC